MERRRLLRIVHEGFRNKNIMPGYLRLSLFGEAKSVVIRRSTPFLLQWVQKYNAAMAPRRSVPPMQLDLRALKYCLPCEEAMDETGDPWGQVNLEGTSSIDRGHREGSSDLFPP